MVEYNKEVIKRYFKRLDSENRGEATVFYIKNFNGKYYEADSYHLRMGVAIKENDIELQKDFYRNSNFEEIEESEYETVVYLYKHGGKYEFKNK